MKRGMSAPFVWIFAMVAGAIVMIFIIQFAFQAVEVDELTSSFKDLNSFETNLDLLTQTKSAKQTVNLPEIEFPCMFNKQYIQTTASRLDTSKIIFSKKQKGSVILKTRLFSYPYPITNIYFISTQELPESAMNLTESLTPYQEFYEDKSQLDCLKQRLIQKIQIVSYIYLQKASILKQNSECKQYYEAAMKLIIQHQKAPTKELAYQINDINSNIKQQGCPVLW